MLVAALPVTYNSLTANPTAMTQYCVFCGSSSGASDVYTGAAHALGRAMVDRDIDLVYGGASIGLMGAIADAVLAAGGKAYGVIPKHLEKHEIAHRNLTDLLIVDNMHDRKAAMADMSTGFIALPGGIGTLEELIEICTWQQLGLHTKPTGLLNINHFYDQLLGFLDHTVAEKFLHPQHRANLISDVQADSLLDQMISSSASPDVFKIDKV